MFLEMPTAGHTVLGDAVATEDAVDVPKHVGLCSCRYPTPEIHIRSHEWETKPATATKAHTKTTHPHCFHTQDLLKRKAAAHEEGFIPRTHL